MLVVPGRPLLLDDAESRLVLASGARCDPALAVGLESGDLKLALDRRTVFANKGYVFDIAVEKCQTAERVETDFALCIVESCVVSIATKKTNPPSLKPERLQGTFAFHLVHGTPFQLLHGEGGHFLGVRVLDHSVIRMEAVEPQEVEMMLDVISSFGVVRTKVQTGHTADFQLGPERVSLSILSSYRLEWRERSGRGWMGVDLAVASTLSRRATARILQYGDRGPQEAP